jgi:predicted nucleotidyltransferase
LEIKRYYKDRLVSVAVYGSSGRLTRRFDSDIALLIVARILPRGRLKRIREFEKVEEKVIPFLVKSKPSGTLPSISPVIKSPEEATKGSPLFFDMVEDARILYDQDKFFSGILQRTGKRLKELGSKRIWKGNAWYWDLKPDYRPGEIFDL